MEYNGGKFLPNFERSKLGPGAKIEKSDATFADLPIFFQSAKTIFFCGDSLKVKFDKAKSLFFNTLRLHGDHHWACLQKLSHFSFFKSFPTQKN